MSAATVKYLTAAETAKHVRAALKAAFPATKFSVRSDAYSLGASIRVRWTDGPTNSAVAAVVNRFQGSDFDALTDLSTARPPIEVDGETVRSGADHVFTDRTQSAEYRQRLHAIAEQILGEPVDEAKWYDQVRGQYVTEWGTWRSATGYNLLTWLAEHVPAGA